MLPFIAKHHSKVARKNKFRIVEDGDPKHSMRCCKTNEWFEANGLGDKRVLTNIPCDDDKTTFTAKIPRSDPPRFHQVTRRKTTAQMRELGRWPANSPELNLQEHAWSWIERKLNTMNPIYDRSKLMKTVAQLWEEWDLNAHRNACKSYEDRLWNLIEKEGGQICGRMSPHNRGAFPTREDVADSDSDSDEAGPSCQLFTSTASTSARKPKATKAKSRSKPKGKGKGKAKARVYSFLDDSGSDGESDSDDGL